jgi:hypothetical protein
MRYLRAWMLDFTVIQLNQVPGSARQRCMAGLPAISAASYK